MAVEIFRIREGRDELLESERERVLALLHKLLPAARIDEVGSTVVPGAIGKQDVDILVLLGENQFDAACAVLDQVLVHDDKQLDSECFRGYRASSCRDVSVQVTVAGGRYDNFHAFAEALRRSPVLLQAYNRLKRAWDGKPMDEYRIAKSEFIAKVLRRS